MRVVIIAVRILLGAIFVLSSIEFFFGLSFIPKPRPSPAASDFINAMMPSHYFEVVKSIELIGGICLVVGIFVPIGIVLLTPVIVNILLWDLLLMHQPGLGIPLMAMVLLLMWGYWPYLKGVFTVFAHPFGKRADAVK